MTEQQRFLEKLEEDGYGAPETKTYPPHADGEMHTHDESVRLLILEGEFRLAQPSGGTTVFGPGEVCELAAGSRHVEQTGADGARVVLGKK